MIPVRIEKTPHFESRNRAASHECQCQQAPARAPPNSLVSVAHSLESSALDPTGVTGRSLFQRPGSGIGSGPGVLNHVDNISANGILCHTIKPIPLMTRIAIALELPKPIERRLDAEGVVVRCDPHEQGDDHFIVAILFTKIDEADHEAISEFVEMDLQEPEEDELNA